MTRGTLDGSLVDMCISKWIDVLKPGCKISVDESMFVSYGREFALGGMPTGDENKEKV